MHTLATIWKQDMNIYNQLARLSLVSHFKTLQKSGGILRANDVICEHSKMQWKGSL